MSNDLRYRLHHVIDKLPSDHLADVLCFVEMLVTEENTVDNMDMEEAWLLSSGAFRLILQDNGELPIVIES